MKKRDYYLVAGLVFLFAFVLHLVRVVLNLPLVLGDVIISMWVSYLVVIVSGFLVFYSFKMLKITKKGR